MQSGPPIAEIHHHLRTAQAKEKGREGDGDGERERKSVKIIHAKKKKTAADCAEFIGCE